MNDDQRTSFMKTYKEKYGSDFSLDFAAAAGKLDRPNAQYTAVLEKLAAQGFKQMRH